MCLSFSIFSTSLAVRVAGKLKNVGKVEKCGRMEVLGSPRFAGWCLFTIYI